MELLPKLREQPGWEGEDSGCARQGGMSVVVVEEVVVVYNTLSMIDSWIPVRRISLLARRKKCTDARMPAHIPAYRKASA